MIATPGMKRRPLCWAAASLLLLFGPLPTLAAGQDSARVALRPLTVTVQAFAQVVSQHRFRVAAPLAGHLSALTVRAGDRVQKGEQLGRLGGPGIDAQIESLRQSVSGDQAGVSATRAVLDSVRQKAGERLATHDALIRARLALTRARSQLKTDQARLKSLQAQTVLIAPATGAVSGLSAANGDFLKVGQTILQIRPARALWLSAEFYGRQGSELQPGQKAQFAPDGGGQPLPVTLATLMPDPDAPGTWQAYFTADQTRPNWFAGQAGTVSVKGPAHPLPAVPSDALILNQGAWWVMVDKSGGAQPVRVTPAASRDGWTWISQGLKAGQTVMVKGAYQAYHRDFARQYANPD